MTNEGDRAAICLCRKCGGSMVDGKALIDVYGGIPDFIGGDVVTVSPTGNAKMVHCLKCETCGHSIAFG
jgi:hypothetical protein